jgi:hypothetical protein
MADQPDEIEMAVPDFTEAAEDAPVGISLETLSDLVQRAFSHELMIYSGDESQRNQTPAPVEVSSGN